MQKENVLQALVILDHFNDEFFPMSDCLPTALVPIVNAPLIEYTLKFLSLTGVKETIIFCSTHVDQIRSFIKSSVSSAAKWSIPMKTTIVSNENCKSLGDCLRDIYSRGLINSTFVLIESGVISNMKLLPAIEKHIKTAHEDPGAVSTLVFQTVENNNKYTENIVLGTNAVERILFYDATNDNNNRRIKVPLSIFLENSYLSMVHNVRDTCIAICSPSVLSLFADNFDFQSKANFINGLLMNEEIMGNSIYAYTLKDNEYGNAVFNWNTFWTTSMDIKNFWAYPLVPDFSRNKVYKKSSLVANSSIIKDCLLEQSIIGENVKLGKACKILNSIVFPNCTIEDNVELSHCIIGSNCLIKSNVQITSGSVIGEKVILEPGEHIEGLFLQTDSLNSTSDSTKLVKFGSNSYKIDSEDIVKKFKSVVLNNSIVESSDESDECDESDVDDLSYTHSPIPDDTKYFFTEIIDSLSRGFDDKLHCDNLILEINSSRYAYNMNLKEVNTNVIKAILELSLKIEHGTNSLKDINRLLSYFSPIINNYIKNEEAMNDALNAIEDVIESNENTSDKWVTFILQWFYDEDYINEELILKWYHNLSKENKLYLQVTPFAQWLEEAEEESSETD